MREIVETYEAFRERLDTLGFLSLGAQCGGLLSLADITRPEAWHRDPPETNPWNWKDWLAEAKEGAYASVLDGKNTLIAPTWYPMFLAAYRGEIDWQEEYEAGLLPELTLRMVKLFEQRPLWARYELTRELGVRKETKSAFERALGTLQTRLWITKSGNAQRMSMEGAPMGWPSMAYARVDAWTPAPWREAARAMDPAEARARLRARAVELGAEERKLERLFAFPA